MKNYFFTFWISGVLMVVVLILGAINTSGSCMFSGVFLGIWLALAKESWKIEDDRKRGRRDD